MMTERIVPLAVIIIGMIMLHATTAACVLTVSMITLAPIAENVITWKVVATAELARTALTVIIPVQAVDCAIIVR